ncbi:hypothetical protein WI85_06855 [Burkholderia ubonensis]|uniref:hypothetical protein n=1 Tax=Burkholderia ubonensis TaxID=101571 RepID=UPI00075C404D|nr:hypothetical protein [Burkholderia ubonensis]KVD55643.1 hypothetical protein WI85_06855 [Burkholderia ubonensis]
MLSFLIRRKLLVLTQMYTSTRKLRGSTLFEDADFAAVEGDDVFSVFQGTLLNGISFDMDRAEIASRMGPSTLFDEAFNAEARGIGNGVRIFLDYDDAFKKIKFIQIGLVLARDMVK